MCESNIGGPNFINTSGHKRSDRSQHNDSDFNALVSFSDWQAIRTKNQRNLRAKHYRLNGFNNTIEYTKQQIVTFFSVALGHHILGHAAHLNKQSK